MMLKHWEKNWPPGTLWFQFILIKSARQSTSKLVCIYNRPPWPCKNKAFWCRFNDYLFSKFCRSKVGAAVTRHDKNFEPVILSCEIEDNGWPPEHVSIITAYSFQPSTLLTIQVNKHTYHGFLIVTLLRSAVGKTHDLQSDLWWTIPLHILLDRFGIPFGFHTISGSP